jgi:diguanylate cyclase (GGDEF)-like protein/PAS domain S-box-containing protein
MTEQRRSGWRAAGSAAAVAAVVITIYLAGWLEWAERHLMDLRFAAQERSPGGQVVVVAIDPKSLSSLATWPWPRDYHATILENLLAAGARQVAFDVDFSSSSSEDEDAALAEQIRRAGRRALLPVFYQWQPTGDGGHRLVVTRPLPELAAHATLVSINIQPDPDGLVRRYGVEALVASAAPPSMASVLAGRERAGADSFYLDFSIDAASIPVVSYLDVLTGVAPPGVFAGRSVIVGATALELGDRAAVPLGGAVPGPLLQALAFESLSADRALSRAPAPVVVGLILLAALVAGLPMQRVSWRYGLVILVGGLAILLIFAMLIQRSLPVIIDIAPGAAALAGCFGVALMRRVDQQEMKAWLASRMARQAELRMRYVVENCSEAIVTLDESGRIETSNRAAESLFARPTGEMLGRSFWELVPDLPSEWCGTAGATGAATGGTVVRHRRATVVGGDSQRRTLDLSVSSFCPDGRLVRIVFLQDVTETLRQQERLTHQATHDALTDLPNRALILDRMRQALGEDPSRRAALLMLDLDRFKEINDTLGHATGDRLLCRIAGRLGERLDAGNLIARLGGDEFAVLLPDADRRQAERAARRLAEALAEPFELDGMNLQVDVSVGIALCPDHGRDPGLLLQRADVAMYLAKRRRASICLYDPEADANSLRQLTLHGELRDAIQCDRLELHYQPKLDLESETVVGAEALLRWTHPQHGPLSPIEFIPLAERTGLMRPLTHWVIRRALNQAAQWRNEGLSLPISVNCSARNLLEEDLPETIGRLLLESKIEPDRLVLEITETALIEDSGRSLRVLKDLAGRGVKLSIDDFGTAYSSFDYLRKLPATELKIDHSFVTRMDRDAGDATIVRATIRLAQDFGLQAVAEGIESRAVMDKLRAFGCHQGQGHHISPPLSAAAFRAWHLAHAAAQQLAALAR